MKVFALYILNKAGGLIYQLDLNTELNKLSANDYLVLAGTLHGMHAIMSKLTPIMGTSEESNRANSTTSMSNSNVIATGRYQNPNTNKSGLQSIETDLFNLYMFQTLSGIKFVIITSPNPVVHNLQPLTDNKTSTGALAKQFEQTNELFRKVYIIYSDYVMKDPFYSLDMPIKSVLFEAKVRETLS